MGPLSGPEMPKIFYWRLQKLRPFTPAAAQLNAQVLQSKNWRAYFRNNKANGTPLSLVCVCVCRFDLLLSVLTGLGTKRTKSLIRSVAPVSGEMQ
jgi:hypothetical protein